jgi:hypothetical protein
MLADAMSVPPPALNTTWPLPELFPHRDFHLAERTANTYCVPDLYGIAMAFSRGKSA